MNESKIEIKEVTENRITVLLNHRIENSKTLKQAIPNYSTILTDFFIKNSLLKKWDKSYSGRLTIKHIYKKYTPQNQIKDNDNYHPLAIKGIIDSFVNSGLIQDDSGNHLEILFTMGFDDIEGTLIIYQRRRIDNE